jgi:cytosine/adenosine deaminase-related metal-dependent hydrolase
VLRAGAPADLVIHPGRSSAEVVGRPAHGRQLIRAGQRCTPELPDFRELDAPGVPGP